MTKQQEINTANREELLREEVHKELDEMRQYIIDTVWKVQDEKLLKILYTRAKNINKM